MSVEVITTISPTTNEPIVTRNGISHADLALLPETAAKAFKTWRTTKLSDRQIIVRKALDTLASRTDELAKELTEQMGRPIAYTGKEITTAIRRAEFLLKASDEALKDSPGEAEKGFERFIRKAPVGPVLIIFAWNVSLGPFCLPSTFLSAFFHFIFFSCPRHA
jgi:acyl-CoA reductase-like NAD-dependent aldehyde dehydrogenase